MKLAKALLLSLGLVAGNAAFAAWPERPVTIIVPASAGGTTDIVARMLSEKMGNDLGQTVVVENRAGAAGIIGTQALVRAKPDGYTLVMGNMARMPSTTAFMIPFLIKKKTSSPLRW